MLPCIISGYLCNSKHALPCTSALLLSVPRPDNTPGKPRKQAHESGSEAAKQNRVSGYFYHRSRTWVSTFSISPRTAESSPGMLLFRKLKASSRPLRVRT